MKSRNPTFENSLACLQHPITLLSIAILLLNDHVFKVISPSWWTGKLSDFAGLFFFPFIVAAGLSLILSKFNLSRQRIGQIAFGLVAVWFVLLKTSPLVNSLTAQVASFFVGRTAQLILDPSDLIALIVLLPAWTLWQGRTEVVITRRAYISLALGALACLATSPAVYSAPFDNIVALSYSYTQKLLYASGAGPDQISQSTDFGNHWFRLENPVNITRAKNTTARQPQLQVCDMVLKTSCYKIEDKDQILVSYDGGNTWQVNWEVPPKRQEYVMRVIGRIEVHDLLIVDYRERRVLFAAAGKYGILRKQLPDGDWMPLAVEDAQPVQFYAMDFLSAVNTTGRECIIWVVVAFFALLITHILIWAKSSVDKKIHDLLSWLYFTFNFAMVVVIVELLLVFTFSAVLELFSVDIGLVPINSDDPVSVLTVALTILILFSWLLLRTNTWVLKLIANQNSRRYILFYSALTLFGVFLLGYLPWLFWAFGIIERYQRAMNISISTSILSAMLGNVLVRNQKS